jgi:elongation factor G
MLSPSYALAVAPQTKSDLDKMVESMSRLAEEDPSLEIVRDAETHETVIRGLGDVHVETAVARIQRKFGVNLETSTPKIAYRETISGVSRSEYRHRKQTGGHGQYGHVVIELRPLERGEGFSFDRKVVGGSVPKDYIPAVEKGIVKSMESGPLGGFPIVDIGVTLVDGSSHSVDSSGMAFEIAGSHALRQGIEQAQPVLLEPVMLVRVMAPDDVAGDVISDLNGRRAHIRGMTPAAVGYTVVEAAVPQEAMLRYATDLRSITHGKASFEAAFLHYDVVPAHLMSRIVGEVAVAAGG